MAEMRQGPSGFAEIVAAYVVTLDVTPGRTEDADTAARLEHSFERRRGEIAEELSRRAQRVFGPAFGVDVRPGRPVASIRSLVLAGVYYPVKAGTATVGALRSFAYDIEDTIAAAVNADGAQPQATVTVELDEASIQVPDASTDSGWERMTPLLGAIATGIGVLGFVTLVGGAIAWARFNGAGLSAEDAVGFLPTQNLIVIGAETLLPAVVIALVITAGVFVVRAFLSRQSQGDPTTAQKHSRDLARGIIIGVLIAAVELVAAVIALAQSFGIWQVFAFLVVGPLIASVAGVIAYYTDRFAFLAAAIFFGIALFLSGARFAAAWGNTDVRPAAVVRDHKLAIIGFYLAEDNKRVYLARLDLVPRSRQVDNHIERKLSRIVAIKKDDITDISIGPPDDALAARDRARDLADELCGIQLLPGNGAAAGRSTKC